MAATSVVVKDTGRMLGKALHCKYLATGRKLRTLVSSIAETSVVSSSSDISKSWALSNAARVVGKYGDSSSMVRSRKWGTSYLVLRRRIAALAVKVWDSGLR